MIGFPRAALATLAAVGDGENEVPNFPLFYQIACAVLVALFLWSFSIARDPRGWRRLYQAKFTRREDFSVNRNKSLDEDIKKYGISVAMTFLLAAVSLFVLGVTYRYRHTESPMSKEDRVRMEDSQRILHEAPKNTPRKVSGGG